MSFFQFFSLFVATAVVYVLYKIYGIATGGASPTIASIPGLSSGNVFIGNIKEIMLSDQAVMHQPCVREYGTTFKFKGVLWQNWLFSVDVKTISHILKKDTTTWQKPPSFTYNLMEVLGQGLVIADSDLHHKQRKILNPAFAPTEIKEFTETFLDKAVKLRDIWTSQIQHNGDEARIDVLPWLSKMAMDVIGETGFGYKFDTLTEDPHHKNELHEAFKVIFNVGTAPKLMRLLRGLIPITRYLPDERDAETAKAKKTMARIGQQLLTERKLVVDSQHSGNPLIEGNDLLSHLVQANISDDGDEQLSDEHVLAQIPTFIVAGHETTSTGIMWALFSLAQDQAIQTRLREELLAVPTENPTMDELNSLTYLDAVMRETLRFHPPIPATIRQATEDDVLPLQTPIVDKVGKVHHELRVTKGQLIFISIATLHRLESIWGTDAQKFNPDRWSSPPKAAMNIPGVWGNLFTFFGGPRACIGYRFSLAEMKASLFTLIRAFEFKLAVPAEDIIKCSEIVARPLLKTDLTGPNQLPLLVRPVVR